MARGKYLNNAGFAALAGVSRTSIGRCLKTTPPRIHKEEDGSINPDHPLNIEYVRQAKDYQNRHRQKLMIGKAAEKELQPDKLDEMLDQIKNLVAISGVQSPDQRPAIPSAGADNKLENYKEEVLREHVVEKVNANDLDFLKKQKIQIGMAIQLKELVPLEFVDKYISLITGAMTNAFMSFGEKVTPEIMAICGIDDTKTKTASKNIINEEVMKAQKMIHKEAKGFSIAVRELKPKVK